MSYFLERVLWVGGLLTLSAACGRAGYDPLLAEDAAVLPEIDAAQADDIDAGAGFALGDTPVLLGTGGFPFEIESEGHELFWTDYGTGALHRFTPDSTDSIELLGARTNSSANVFGLDVHDGFVYLCDSATGQIRRVATDGRSATVIATSPCQDLVVMGPHLYWTSSDDTEPALRRLLLPDGDPELVNTPGASTNLATDGTALFYTVYGAGEIHRQDLDGGPSRIIATVDVGGPWGLTVSGGFVYIAEHHGSGGQVSRVSTNGGALEVVAPGQAGAHKVAVDGNTVYWTSEFDGTLMKLEPGTTPQALVKGLDSPLGLALTETSIFWTTRAGELWGVDK